MKKLLTLLGILLILISCKKERSEVIEFDLNQIAGLYEVDFFQSNDSIYPELNLHQGDSIFIQRLGNDLFTFTIPYVIPDSALVIDFKVVGPYTRINSYFTSTRGLTQLVNNTMFEESFNAAYGNLNHFRYTDSNTADCRFWLSYKNKKYDNSVISIYANR